MNTAPEMAGSDTTPTSLIEMLGLPTIQSFGTFGEGLKASPHSALILRPRDRMWYVRPVEVEKASLAGSPSPRLAGPTVPSGPLDVSIVVGDGALSSRPTIKVAPSGAPSLELLIPGTFAERMAPLGSSVEAGKLLYKELPHLFDDPELLRQAEKSRPLRTFLQQLHEDPFAELRGSPVSLEVRFSGGQPPMTFTPPEAGYVRALTLIQNDTISSWRESRDELGRASTNDALVSAFAQIRKPLLEIAAGKSKRLAAKECGISPVKLTLWLSGSLPPTVRAALVERRSQAERPLTLPRDESEEFAYILGAFAAASRPGTPAQRLSLATQSAEVAERLRGAMEKVFGRTIEMRQGQVPPRNNTEYEVRLLSLACARYLNEVTSLNSRIPWEHLVTSAEKIAFLRGYLDKASSVSRKGGIDITKTGGEQLLRELAVLFSQVGLYPRLLTDGARTILKFSEYGEWKKLHDTVGYTDPDSKAALGRLVAKKPGRTGYSAQDFDRTIAIAARGGDIRAVAREANVPYDAARSWIGQKKRPHEVERRAIIAGYAAGMPDPRVIGAITRNLGGSSTVAREIASALSFEEYGIRLEEASGLGIDPSRTPRALLDLKNQSQVEPRVEPRDSMGIARAIVADFRRAGGDVASIESAIGEIRKSSVDAAGPALRGVILFLLRPDERARYRACLRAQRWTLPEPTPHKPVRHDANSTPRPRRTPRGQAEDTLTSQPERLPPVVTIASIDHLRAPPCAFSEDGAVGVTKEGIIEIRFRLGDEAKILFQDRPDAMGCAARIAAIMPALAEEDGRSGSKRALMKATHGVGSAREDEGRIRAGLDLWRAVRGHAPKFLYRRVQVTLLSPQGEILYTARSSAEAFTSNLAARLTDLRGKLETNPRPIKPVQRDLLIDRAAEEVRRFSTAAVALSEGESFSAVAKDTGISVPTLRRLIRPAAELPNALRRMEQTLTVSPLARSVAIPRIENAQFAYVVGVLTAANIKPYRAGIVRAHLYSRESRENFVRAVAATLPGIVVHTLEKELRGIPRFEARIDSIELARAINLLTGMSKHLPWACLGTAAEKESFVRGYLSVSGHHSKRQIKIGTHKGARFAAELATLLSDVGLVPNVEEGPLTKLTLLDRRSFETLVTKNLLEKPTMLTGVTTDLSAATWVAKPSLDVYNQVMQEPLDTPQTSTRALAAKYGVGPTTIGAWRMRGVKPVDFWRVDALRTLETRFDIPAYKLINQLVRGHGIDFSQAFIIVESLGSKSLSATLKRCSDMEWDFYGNAEFLLKAGARVKEIEFLFLPAERQKAQAPSESELDRRSRILHWAKSIGIDDSSYGIALSKIVEHHLPAFDGFVANTMKRYRLSSKGIEFEDVKALVCIHITNCLATYDPEKGSGFRPYVAAFLKSTIQHEINKLTGYDYQLQKKILQLGPNPGNLTVEEITERLGCKRKTAREVHQAIGRGTVSLDAPLGEGEASAGAFEAERREKAPDVEAEERDFFREVMSTLEPRERQVIALRYGEGLSFKECGERLGISGSRAQQILEEILEKARATFDSGGD